MSVITPTLADVGSILRARTRSDVSGDESGTFDTSTRPTAAQVNAMMATAEAEVVVHCPADLSTLNERLCSFAKRMVALRCAMFVELSLYPDQSVESDSVYALLERDYERLTKTFLTAMADGDGSNLGRSAMRSATLVTPFSGDDLED